MSIKKCRKTEIKTSERVGAKHDVIGRQVDFLILKHFVVGSTLISLFILKWF